MIRKTIYGGVVAALLAGFFFGRDAWSYARTSLGWVKDSVRSSVPVEFEIERARKMLRDLQPEVRQAKHVIAREEVELERLQNEISAVETSLDSQQAHIMRLKDDLASSQATYQYAGRSYSADEVKVDLARRFARYKTKDATLASLRKVYAAREQGLAAARQNLAGMEASQRQLEVEIENVEARRRIVEAAQTTCNYQFDDSRLSRLKQLVTDIGTRLQVDEKLVNVDEAFTGEIPLDEPTPDDIVDQVTHYFEAPARPEAEVAAAQGAN